MFQYSSGVLKANWLPYSPLAPLVHFNMDELSAYPFQFPISHSPHRCSKPNIVSTQISSAKFCWSGIKTIRSCKHKIPNFLTCYQARSSFIPGQGLVPLLLYLVMVVSLSQMTFLLTLMPAKGLALFYILPWMHLSSQHLSVTTKYISKLQLFHCITEGCDLLQQRLKAL